MAKGLNGNIQLLLLVTMLLFYSNKGLLLFYSPTGIKLLNWSNLTMLTEVGFTITEF